MATHKARRWRQRFHRDGANQLIVDRKLPNTRVKAVPCGVCFEPITETSVCRTVWTPDDQKLFKARMASPATSEITYDYAALPDIATVYETAVVNATNDGWASSPSQSFKRFHQTFLHSAPTQRPDMLLTFNGQGGPTCQAGNSEQSQTANSILGPAGNATSEIGAVQPLPQPIIGTSGANVANFPRRMTYLKTAEIYERVVNWTFRNGVYRFEINLVHTQTEYTSSSIEPTFTQTNPFGNIGNIGWRYVNAPVLPQQSLSYSGGLHSAFRSDADYKGPSPIVDTMTVTSSQWGGTVNVGFGTGGVQSTDVIRLGPFE